MYLSAIISLCLSAAGEGRPTDDMNSANQLNANWPIPLQPPDASTSEASEGHHDLSTMQRRAKSRIGFHGQIVVRGQIQESNAYISPIQATVSEQQKLVCSTSPVQQPTLAASIQHCSSTAAATSCPIGQRTALKLEQTSPST